VSETIVGLVAHHSCARIEAGLRQLPLDDEFPRDDSLPHDELCFCDLTTSPDGDIVTVDWRIAEIRERYGAGHVGGPVCPVGAPLPEWFCGRHQPTRHPGR
jgi:hypothetical protein